VRKPEACSFSLQYASRSGRRWDSQTRWTPHQLRHAFASHAHARGVTLQDLSMVMGQSTTAVTVKVCIHLYGREEADERFRTAIAN
jgi:site-specific recombinase XerD